MTYPTLWSHLLTRVRVRSIPVGSPIEFSSASIAAARHKAGPARGVPCNDMIVTPSVWSALCSTFANMMTVETETRASEVTDGLLGHLFGCNVWSVPDSIVGGDRDLLLSLPNLIFRDDQDTFYFQPVKLDKGTTSTAAEAPVALVTPIDPRQELTAHLGILRGRGKLPVPVGPARPFNRNEVMGLNYDQRPLAVFINYPVLVRLMQDQSFLDMFDPCTSHHATTVIGNLGMFAGIPVYDRDRLPVPAQIIKDLPEVAHMLADRSWKFHAIDMTMDLAAPDNLDVSREVASLMNRLSYQSVLTAQDQKDMRRLADQVRAGQAEPDPAMLLAQLNHIFQQRTGRRAALQCELVNRLAGHERNWNTPLEPTVLPGVRSTGYTPTQFMLTTHVDNPAMCQLATFLQERAYPLITVANAHHVVLLSDVLSSGNYVAAVLHGVYADHVRNSLGLLEQMRAASASAEKREHNPPLSAAQVSAGYLGDMTDLRIPIYTTPTVGADLVWSLPNIACQLPDGSWEFIVMQGDTQ